MLNSTEHSSPHLNKQIVASASTGKEFGGYYDRFFRRTGTAVSELKDSLGIQFYYGLGMAVQKGTPFLILPLLIYFYGDHTYASYVLFYTTVQIVGVFCSLAIPSSTVVFWYRKKGPRQFLVTYLTLLAGVYLLGAAVCLAPVYYVYKTSLKGAPPLEMAALGLIFVGLYTLNQYFVALYRAQYSSRQFLVAQVVGALVLVAGAIPFHAAPSLSRLVWAFLLSQLAQDCYLFYGAMPILKGASWSDFDMSQAREVIHFSSPLVIYNTLTLFVYWVDKYMLSLYFDSKSFSTFVVTFQFAFAQAMVSQLFALYNFPKICELVAARNVEQLRRLIHSYNSLIVLLGVAYAAAVLGIQFYFHLFHISVSGFLILSVAFLLSNLSTTYLNVLYAHHKTRKIVALQTIASACMFATLAAGCVFHKVAICYSSHLVMAACVLGLFAYTVRRISSSATSMKGTMAIADGAETATDIL